MESHVIFLLQGERVAELILHHARANECKDVSQFKKEMAQLVDCALSNTLSLGKVPASTPSVISSIIVTEMEELLQFQM